jgi:hypothetical protein
VSDRRSGETNTLPSVVSDVGERRGRQPNGAHPLSAGRSADAGLTSSDFNAGVNTGATAGVNSAVNSDVNTGRGAGVFDRSPGDAGTGPRAAAEERRGRDKPSAGAFLDDLIDGQDDAGGFDSPVPSALPDLPTSAAPGSVSPTSVIGRPPMPDDQSVTNPFPEPEPLVQSGPPPRPVPDPVADPIDGSTGARPPGQTPFPGEPAAAPFRRTVAPTGRSRSATDTPGGPGARPRSDRFAQPVDAAVDTPVRDTEFKLADRPGPQGDGPNRLLLVGAMAAVVLIGAAVWFLTRSGGGDAVEVADQSPSSSSETTVDPSGPTQESSQAGTDTATGAGTEPQVDEPTLVLAAAETGPLVSGEPYGIELYGEPEGALLQVVVDGIKQGSPAAGLPDLILPPGRHTLQVDIDDGATVVASTPVDVFVLGQAPNAGWRANLKSVNMVDEGWGEAIAAFDSFRAAGHEAVEVYPLVDGFWNIFVADFADRPAAIAYCESFGLSVPEECFAGEIEGPPAGSGSDAATDSGTDGDAMTEDGDATTTDGDAMTTDGDGSDDSSDG